MKAYVVDNKEHTNRQLSSTVRDVMIVRGKDTDTEWIHKYLDLTCKQFEGCKEEEKIPKRLTFIKREYTESQGTEDNFNPDRNKQTDQETTKHGEEY